MKRKFRFLSLALVLVLSMGLLAACGSDDADDTTMTEDESGTQTSSTFEESSETNTEAEDVIGEISYISSLYMSLNVYEPVAEVIDYASLDVSTLTASYSTESITIDSDAEYYYISDSPMVSQTSADLEAGDMVAVTTSEDGTQQIILLEKGDGDSTGSSTEYSGSDAEYTAEDVVAEVAAIDGDTLTLTVYEAVDTATAISDYTQVNLEDYIATETEDTYTIDSTVSVYVVEDGVMVISDSSEIVVGDMLVIYTTESGTSSIAIYHAE